MTGQVLFTSVVVLSDDWMFCDVVLRNLVKTGINGTSEKRKAEAGEQSSIGRSTPASFFQRSAASFRWHALYNIEERAVALTSVDVAEFSRSLVILHANRAF